MPRRTSSIDGEGSLSRKRTADMLRRLRELTREVKMLKAQIAVEGETERRPRTLRAARKHQLR